MTLDEACRFADSLNARAATVRPKVKDWSRLHPSARLRYQLDTAIATALDEVADALRAALAAKGGR